MLKRFFLLIVVCSATLLVRAVGISDRVSYQRSDSITICSLLAEAKRMPASTNFPLFFARKFLGLPYVAYTLESSGKERLVINTRQLDCTTLVENVTALTLCANRGHYAWESYLQTLREMRYRDGIVDGYPSRIHYFTEWITSNTVKGIVNEIQSPESVFSALQTVRVDYMSKHPKSYKALSSHPEYISKIRQMEQNVSGGKFRYIPKAGVTNSQLLRRAITDGDIIAITSKKQGLDIAHLGFAVWKADGLHLLNASQLHKKVVEEPMTLGQYLQKHPSHSGIRIIRIKKQ